jgi:2,3-bisphosphoglycerate-dependent phosphoglycerate mutase
MPLSKTEMEKTALKTTVYFVRHAESPYMAGEERSRGLSPKGEADALRVTAILEQVGIDVYVSSPYKRAIQTIKSAANHYSIEQIEDLREREVGIISEGSFLEAKNKLYADFGFSFPGGESSAQAQKRGVQALLQLLKAYEGRRIAIGTHGDIMTLMLNYFDKSFHYDFWKSTTMPDIYRLDFEGTDLVQVAREWVHEAKGGFWGMAARF